MNKSIRGSLLLVAALAVLLTAVLSVGGCYRIYEQQMMNQQRERTEMLESSMKFIREDVKFLEAVKKAAGELRVTLIDEDGTVLFDSEAPAATMENHNTRREVIEARAHGTGEERRTSATEGVSTHYYAMLGENGVVLRTGLRLQNIGAVFANNMPLLVGVVLLMLLLSVWLSRMLTRRLIQPIRRAAQNLSGEEVALPSAEYEELEPFMSKIRAQQAQRAADLEYIAQEKTLLDMITTGIHEGLILIDGNKNVLSVNQGALALLGAHKGNYTGHSVLALCRESEFSRGVDRAVHEKESSEMVMQEGERQLRVRISPTEGVPGAMILLVDASEQIFAERQRRDFSANVSHELKTPLTSISGYAEMIESGMAQPEDVANFAHKIHAEAGRLRLLIDDIMRLSQIEEGVGQPEKEPVELLQIARETMERMEPEAAEKQVSLSVEGETATICANRHMMEELMTNLLGNAVKYNKVGGKASITIERRGRRTAIIVADTGIGIAPEHQGRVFERFYRVDKSRSKQTGGTGLGLSIVRHIAAYHEGTVSLQSEENIGTTITVLLP